MNGSEMICTYDLTRAYLDDTEVWAVDEVSLSVARGEFVALLGRSGAGKSTLLRLLAGRERPSFGRALVDGIDVGALRGRALADYRRERVGYLPQHPELLGELTVLENVVLPLLPYARHCPFDLQGRARELLRVLGLGGRLAQHAAHLSAGEAERAALARALLCHPPLLLLDEPAASLDRRTGGEAVGLLDRLVRGEGLTVLLATRDATLAELGDRVLRMERGQVLEGQAHRAGEHAWVTVQDLA